MSTSKLGVVIDALVSALTTALPDADVVDGPAVNRPNIGRDTLYIGWSGEEGDNTSANADQEWASLGNRARNEAMVIVCRAHTSSGETVMKPVRDAALALVAATEAALRTDPQLGSALVPPGLAQFGSIRTLNQLQTEQGAQCGAVFTVNVTARL